MQVLGNNSKTVNNIKNLTWSKNDQHSKIYILCNFEVNPKNLILIEKKFFTFCLLLLTFIFIKCKLQKKN
jgi:hypothetical protein